METTKTLARLLVGATLVLGAHVIFVAPEPAHADGAVVSVEGLGQVILYCKDIGSGRKRVWMNTDDGTYALNGQAISWVQEAEAEGDPLIGNDGKPAKLARDHLPLSVVGDLISDGLALCN